MSLTDFLIWINKVLAMEIIIIANAIT